MNKYIKGIIAIIVIGVSAFIATIEAKADEETDSPNFSVRAILPENQLKDITGYFHLDMNNQKEQTLSVEVTNNTENSLTIIPTLATATTNSNGLINYRSSDEAPDESIDISFGDIASLNYSEIVLDPLETKAVNIAVDIPNTSFEGQILGGISFEEFIIDEEEENPSMVINRFAYNIAILMELGSALPENELELNTVQASQRAGFNFIEANLQNSAPRLISSLDVTATVYEVNSESPIYTSTQTGMKMAPNSNFNYGIDIQQTAFEPGEYRIKLNVSADGKTYEFEQNFTITSEQANTLNETAVLKESNNNNLVYWVLIMVLVCIAFGILFFTKRTKERKK